MAAAAAGAAGGGRTCSVGLQPLLLVALLLLGLGLFAVQHEGLHVVRDLHRDHRDTHLARALAPRAPRDSPQALALQGDEQAEEDGGAAAAAGAQGAAGKRALRAKDDGGAMDVRAMTVVLKNKVVEDEELRTFVEDVRRRLVEAEGEAFLATEPDREMDPHAAHNGFVEETTDMLEAKIPSTLEVRQFMEKRLRKTVDIVRAWPPQDPDSKPADWQDLAPRLNYLDPVERRMAYVWRQAAFPFVLQNVPQVVEAAKQVNPDFLASKFRWRGGKVEISQNATFMYWKHAGRGEKAPTSWSNGISWQKFLKQANKPDLKPTDMHYYWHFSSREHGWLKDLLPHFSPKNHFFIVDRGEFTNGIASRIGMKGVCNVGHFDTHLTFASHLMGTKRWILSPPESCPSWNLLRSGMSARHMPTDMGLDQGQPNLEKYPNLADALALDLVVHPGEMVFLPSNWNHYIISLNVNLQAIARSGHSLVGDDIIEKCGFPRGHVHAYQRQLQTKLQKQGRSLEAVRGAAPPAKGRRINHNWKAKRGTAHH